MNLVILNKTIKDIALSTRGVYSFYSEDPYVSWNSAETKYGSVSAAIENVTYSDQFATYSYIFYYGDRLLADNSNAQQLYSDGVRIIQSIINEMNQSGTVDISDDIIYTPYQQKFMDNLGGVYASVNINVPSELGICDIEEMEEEEPEPPVPTKEVYRYVADYSSLTSEEKKNGVFLLVQLDTVLRYAIVGTDDGQTPPPYAGTYDAQPVNVIGEGNDRYIETSDVIPYMTWKSPYNSSSYTWKCIDNDYMDMKVKYGYGDKDCQTLFMDGGVKLYIVTGGEMNMFMMYRGGGYFAALESRPSTAPLFEIYMLTTINE